MSTFVIWLGVAALFAFRHPLPSTAHVIALHHWTGDMTALAMAIINQAAPVSTALTLAAIATALTVACTFGGRAEWEMRTIEVIRLRFLEKVTKAVCLIAGSLLITTSSILPFAGIDGLISAVIAFGSGLLSFSLAAMVPVTANYWEAQLTKEVDALKRLETAPIARVVTRTQRALWVRYMIANIFIRFTWALSFLIVASAMMGLGVRWALALVLLLTYSTAMAILWDWPVTWFWLEVRTTWIVDRWTAAVHILTGTCTILLLLIFLLQASLAYHWTVAALAVGSCMPPLITAISPVLNRSFQGLRTNRFQNVLSQTRNNILRFENYRALAAKDPHGPNASQYTPENSGQRPSPHHSVRTPMLTHSIESDQGKASQQPALPRRLLRLWRARGTPSGRRSRLYHLHKHLGGRNDPH